MIIDKLWVSSIRYYDVNARTIILYTFGLLVLGDAMLVSKVVLRSNSVMHSIKKIIFYFDLEIKVRIAFDCWGTCGKFYRSHRLSRDSLAPATLDYFASSIFFRLNFMVFFVC